MKKRDEWKKPYMILVDGIDNAISQLDNINVGKAKDILKEALQKAEDEYVNQD